MKDTETWPEADLSPEASVAPPDRPTRPEPVPVYSVALTGLLVVAVFYTLSIARSVFLPITLALFLSVLLSPVVSALALVRIPRSVGAALTLGLVVAPLLYGLVQLTEPATVWMQRLPESVGQMEDKIRKLRQPAERVSRAAERVEQMAAATDPSPQKPVQTVEVKPRGWFSGLLTGTTNVLSGLAITVGLLYFLLVSGDTLLRKWVQLLPTFAEKRRAVAIARDTASTLAVYLSTITGINICLGVLTGLAMAWLGMPNPVLWGVVGGVLNFIPYAGALIAVIVLGLAAFLHFDSLGPAVLPPLIYWLLTVSESGLVSPLLLGRRLSLNPVMIVISLIFWGWLWGVPGALLAVPILMSFKIFCDHSKTLTGLGQLLGR